MTNYPWKFIGPVSLVILTLAGQPTVWASELESIRFGEAARTFAAGSIQQTTPQDGVVNVITGDNQTNGNRMRLGQSDVLYLKLKNPGEAAVGDLFTVFKRTRKVFHPVTGDYMGYLINRLAIVEVIQVDHELTTVRAVRAYGAISPGDPVVKFSLPTQEGSASASDSSDVMGMVVELQSDMGMTLVAQWNIVYLDRGLEDGLKAGDRVELVRFGGALPPRTMGEVKILSTEARTATALITKAKARILKGDRFRTNLQVGGPVSLPVSQPTSQSLSNPPPVDNASDKIQTQTAARETRYSLSDLMMHVRYDSGEATIKPEGFQVLEQLVTQLKAAPPDQLIRVEGHTDDMEIGPSLKSIYPTNWDLSKARAGGVVRYLIEKGGIDSARISSIGYGDSKPVSSNATEDGRLKNRRVDIVLYSAESAKVPSEQTMKPAESVDNGYQITGVGSDDRNASVPAADTEASGGSVKMDDSSSTPTGPSGGAIPALGDQSAPQQTTDQSIVPPQP
jgi:chemotaxis protein MotB